MNLYKFEVTDNFFPSTFEGETKADNKDSAIQDLKETYAMELGTTEDEIEVLNIQEI